MVTRRRFYQHGRPRLVLGRSIPAPKLTAHYAPARGAVTNRFGGESLGQEDTMPVMDEKVRKQVRAALADMQHPVRMVMFTQGEGGALECDFCQETREIAEEIARLSDRVALDVRDFQGDETLAKSYGVDKIPALVLLADGDPPKDHGIRLYGVPAGYEFSTLIEDLRMLGARDPALSQDTLKALRGLTTPVHIQVFVTPTCPYCPRAVVLAHKLAMASDLVTADMVEATEFPHLANKYQVQGVPRTVINETIHVEGAVPEAALVSQLMSALDGRTV
jgi:glutaredoxin-like protein